MKSELFNSECDEITALLTEGSATEAVNRSGMLLAEADTEWANAFNARRNTPAELSMLLRAAFLHVESLAAAGEAAMALATAVTALYASVVDINTDENTDKGRAMLWLSALRLMLAIAPQVATDETGADHASQITTQAASMLYHYYNRLRELPWPPLAGIHSMLSGMIEAGAVQSPTIRVAGEDVDPADPRPVMADLAGRLRALGLLG